MSGLHYCAIREGDVDAWGLLSDLVDVLEVGVLREKVAGTTGIGYYWGMGGWGGTCGYNVC
jgi:hypothetical protein